MVNTSVFGIQAGPHGRVEPPGLMPATRDPQRLRDRLRSSLDLLTTHKARVGQRACECFLFLTIYSIGLALRIYLTPSDPHLEYILLRKYPKTSVRIFRFTSDTQNNSDSIHLEKIQKEYVLSDRIFHRIFQQAGSQGNFTHQLMASKRLMASSRADAWGQGRSE